MLPFNRQQMSLHNSRQGNPYNEHLMQPSCRRRMIEARDLLFSGLQKGEERRTDDGIYRLMPLIQCMTVNTELPCAEVCSMELCRVLAPLDNKSPVKASEIARQMQI